MEKFAKLLSSEILKTAEDAEFAGRIAARAYADEMQKLSNAFGLDHAEDVELTEDQKLAEQVEAFLGEAAGK